ncbi:MAG: radical SAM peptide maturase, CXXX-repeat target family [Peptococcaceae bacterium]|nr:radical SAM peptide maturase, CXXX-repeat target family [Peptococcaceae bacterium]
MDNNIEVKMGKMPTVWNAGTAKTITFCVTEDCNLRCKYCYFVGKNSKKKMDFETAKKAIDYILSDREYLKEPSVIWEFIGGEPFLEIDLVDKICNYIKLQMFLLDHPWFNSYRFNFSTNGLLYSTPKVQSFIQKNKGHLSIGISVDGNKVKHDLQRVKPDGSGSYDDVIKNVPLWLEQFPSAATKSTFAHDDLPHLKDSIIDLWNVGIKSVVANVVFEDVWMEGDDEIMEQQLRELADYVLANDMWKDHSVRFFDPTIGYALTEEDMERNYCGAGKMLAIDCEGNFYPCVRFYDFSLNNRKGLSVGDIYNGINQDKLRPFLGLNLKSQSKRECIECEVASGCAWCQGNNYDSADSDTIYQRSTYICKIHKAIIRANKYFWERFEQVTGFTSERTKYEIQTKQLASYLLFITSDNITPHCSYRNIKGTDNIMSRGVFEKGIEFCKEKGIIPVMLGKLHNIDFDKNNDYLFIDSPSNGVSLRNMIPVHDNAVNEQLTSENSILLVNNSSLFNLYSLAKQLFQHSSRINIILEDIEKWNDTEIEEYKNQLNQLVAFLAESYDRESRLELNVLTDIWDLKSTRNCGAGINTFSLAPNGKIYICPAFYFDNPDNHIGTLVDGIKIKNSQLLQVENAPICLVCDVYNCRQCKYLNKKLTNEFNTPSKIQCVISHIERNKSMELQNLIMKQESETFDNILKTIDYIDPLYNLLKK